MRRVGPALILEEYIINRCGRAEDGDEIVTFAGYRDGTERNGLLIDWVVAGILNLS